MSRRRLAAPLLLVLALVLVPTGSAGAAGTGPDWRTAVKDLAGSPDDRPATDLRTEAGTLISRSTQDPGVTALLTEAARSSREDYVDGARFLALDKGVQAYATDAELLAWLRGHVCVRHGRTSGGVAALTALLRAGRVTAGVANGDLAAALGQRGADPDLAANAGRRTALLNARSASVAATALLQQAEAALRNGAPSQAYATWTAAWTLAAGQLFALGFAPVEAHSSLTTP